MAVVVAAFIDVHLLVMIVKDALGISEGCIKEEGMRFARHSLKVLSSCFARGSNQDDRHRLMRINPALYDALDLHQAQAAFSKLR